MNFVALGLKIYHINAFDGKITSVNVSGCKNLIQLLVESNYLSSLDVSQNTELELLTCHGNNLTSLDVTNNTKLKEFSCSDTQLSTIDVTKNTALEKLYIQYTPISSVDLSNNTNLLVLDMENCEFEEIDLSKNTKLEKIYFAKNKLTSIAFPNETLEVKRGGGNSYGISVSCDRKFDLSTLPGSFDVSKAYDWVGGTVDGTTLTIDENASEVTYKYKAVCKNVDYAPFKLVVNAAEHQIDYYNFEITEQATCTTDGELKRICTVCDKNFTETIEAKGHDYIMDSWETDSANHWHKCSVCGDINDIASHTEDSGTVTVQPTETTEGTKTFKCSVCGYVIRTEPVPAIGTEHVHDFGKDWKYDTVSHWYECVCGEKSDLAVHIENGGGETLAPTETTEGEMTYRCTVCGAVTRTETIPATGVIPVPTPTPTPTPTPMPTPTPAPPSPPVTYPDPIVSPAVPAANEEPFIVDNRGIEGWEAISEDINITADGNVVDVDMNGTYFLPKNIIEDIAGRDIDLALEMSGGITWTINGLTVTDAQGTNMKVYVDRGRIPNKVIDTVSEGAYVKELTLKHTGEFGFTPVLSVKMPKKYEGKYANLFYYNPKSGEMEFVDFGMIKDGAVKLAFSHASEYAVVVSDVPMGGESVSVAAGVDSRSDFVGTLATEEAPKYGMILIAVVGAAVLALRKCRQK